jgi:hypothetical protein
MWADDYPDLEVGAMRACRIDTPRLTEGTHPYTILEQLIDLWITKHDHVMAYNAQFDRTVLEKECERHGIKLPTIDWICALTDVHYPSYYRCRQLAHIALDHGITVDPKTTHGALADVCLVRDLLEVGGYSYRDVINYRDDPWVYMKAELPKPWGKDAELAKVLQAEAKADGYGWQTAKGTDKPTFEKMWVKRVKLSQLEQEKTKKLNFLRSLIKDENN